MRSEQRRLDTALATPSTTSAQPTASARQPYGESCFEPGRSCAVPGGPHGRTSALHIGLGDRSVDHFPDVGIK